MKVRIRNILTVFTVICHMIMIIILHALHPTSFSMKSAFQESPMHNTVEPLYRGHHWDPAGCPVQRGAPNSEVVLYTALCSWDSRQCSYQRGVLYSECPSQRGSIVLKQLTYRMHSLYSILHYKCGVQQMYKVVCFTVLPSIIRRRHTIIKANVAINCSINDCSHKSIAYIQLLHFLCWCLFI